MARSQDIKEARTSSTGSTFDSAAASRLDFSNAPLRSLCVLLLNPVRRLSLRQSHTTFLKIFKNGCVWLSSVVFGCGASPFPLRSLRETAQRAVKFVFPRLGFRPSDFGL